MSIREASRVYDLDRKTIRKMLSFSVPPGYRRSRPPKRPKLDPFIGIIDQILDEDGARPRKQRHTVKRIFERLRDEHGFEGGQTIVKDYVRERRLRLREMFVPLSHPPGHAQVDFGEAVAIIGGVEQKVRFFVMDLPQSDACFVKAYPAETTEAFCDGHVSAFAFFGGVPQSILYDNTTLAVARILGDGTRQRTRVFAELQSHYLFDDRFGRPGKGNDKGKVEGLVGFVRRNFMVPIPRFESFEAFNADLARQSRRRSAARLRGHRETIGERLVRDQAALLELPSSPYDACDKRPGRVSSLSLVRYKANDYSVPVAYGHREVLVRGYVHEVVICCGAEVIAGHRRSYEREDLIFDPLHYLPLIERKIGALDQAAPLMGWELPEAFATLRRLMEARMGKAGKREYVQVLRLMETFRLEQVEAAVRDALRLGAISFDAVKHLVLCHIERRPPRLNLNLYPYLPRAQVATTSARSYLSLLSEAEP
jgi:transposase